MYRCFASIVIGTLRLLISIIGGAVSGITDAGAPFPGESDVEADRRWRQGSRRRVPHRSV